MPSTRDVCCEPLFHVQGMLSWFSVFLWNRRKAFSMDRCLMCLHGYCNCFWAWEVVLWHERRSTVVPLHHKHLYYIYLEISSRPPHNWTYSTLVGYKCANRYRTDQTRSTGTAVRRSLFTVVADGWASMYKARNREMCAAFESGNHWYQEKNKPWRIGSWGALLILHMIGILGAYTLYASIPSIYALICLH